LDTPPCAAFTPHDPCPMGGRGSGAHVTRLRIELYNQAGESVAAAQPSLSDVARTRCARQAQLSPLLCTGAPRAGPKRGASAWARHLRGNLAGVAGLPSLWALPLSRSGVSIRASSGSDPACGNKPPCRPGGATCSSAGRIPTACSTPASSAYAPTPLMAHTPHDRGHSQGETGSRHGLPLCWDGARSDRAFESLTPLRLQPSWGITNRVEKAPW